MGNSKWEDNETIDCVMVNRRFRNCVKTAQSRPEWRGNMEHQRQNAVETMGICLHFKLNYREKWHESGTNIVYDIARARKQPELAIERVAKEPIYCSYDGNKDVEENWECMKEGLRKALTQTYLIDKDEKCKKVWAYKGYEHATKEETEKLDKLTHERTDKQKQIVKMYKKLGLLTRRKIMRTMATSWVKAAGCLKNIQR